MEPFLIDSHCHLQMLEAKDGRDTVAYMNAARKRGVGYFLTVAVDLAGLPELLAMTERYPSTATTVGVHPCAGAEQNPSPEELAELASARAVLAVGETGLDYLCADESARPMQQERFRRHIRGARLAGKPVIVHTRGAPEDTARILEEEGASEVGGIIHCFTEDSASAERFMAQGFYISFSGILTFRNADALCEVARQLPLDRLLVETDCPYLAPVPHRGRQNEPAFVREVADCLAEIRGEPLETIAQATTENFRRLFPTAKLTG